MDFTWNSINKPVFVLAPMANITTLPFRSICNEMGADIVYTPMLSSNALVYNKDKTLNIGASLPGERSNTVVQLFGYDSDLISRAANIVQTSLKPAGIDINMGCPAPKITGNESGSALLKDISKASELVKEVRNNFNGELSVKLRLGWSEFNIIELVKNLETIGVNSISVHGRTARQGYRGKADWEAIYNIADSVKIPVIGNGDIKTWQEAYQRLDDSHLAGVMIGRSALGNPWIFKEIKEKRDLVISRNELAKTILIQAKRYIDFVGEKIAMREMRKHLGWYIKNFEGASEIRKKAMLIVSYNDLLEVLTMLKSF